MSRIIKSDENIVNIPMNVTVLKNGYVYFNQNTTWVKGHNEQKGYADHKKISIGFALNPGSDWRKDRRMYANKNYYRLFGNKTIGPTDDGAELPDVAIYGEYPERSNTISVGLYSVIKNLLEDSNLGDLLVDVFGSQSSCLILDLSMYMLSSSTAVFQHYPHWAKSHALFSESIHSDSYISNFLKEKISLSEINLFKQKWAQQTLDDGKVYICYDSTNVNSQAEGIFIVQKGHAKDDADKDQVNTEYTIRQRDGMPVSFKNFPGSINDMSEAPEMIAELKSLLQTQSANYDETTSYKTRIILIADRGYVSEENIISMRDANIGFILMLKKNMSIVDIVLDEYVSQVKKAANYDAETGRFGITVQRKLFDDDTTDTFFHIIWNGELEQAHRVELMRRIASQEEKLHKAIERHTKMTSIELATYQKYFFITCHEDGTLVVNQRGRGAGKTTKVPAYVIDSFEQNQDAINFASDKCGYMTIVSSDEMSYKEVLIAMSKRESVEKTFRTLKSSLGMDKIGIHSESSLHTKSLIWFVASILHALIFSKTEKLRLKDHKRFTVKSLMNQYEEITADKDLLKEKYFRRYKLTKIQQQCLKPCGVSLQMIDQDISGL